MNTYQFVWARDTHTFSCHHNTEPTTSTTRADSSSDSSTGPLKARQRCSLEEAAAGEAGTEEGRALAPAPRMGRGGGMELGERGGEKETNQTNPPGERVRDAARGGWNPQRAEMRPGTGPSLQPGRGAHRPPTSSTCCPPRPAHATPASVQKPKAGSTAQVGSAWTPRCVRGTLRQRRHAAAPPRSQPSGRTPRRPRR